MKKKTESIAPTAAADAETSNGDEQSNDDASLEELLALEQARAEEFRENWMRERADFVNYRRRVENERSELTPQANAALLTSLLPVVDDFDLALASIPADVASSKWTDGIVLIHRKLQKILEAAEVTPIEALNRVFDPRLHEAVIAEEGSTEPYVVVTDLRRGYLLRDKVLRPSMVKVGSAATPSTQ